MRRVHVFVRHCWASEVSAHKPRPAWFDRERCFKRLLATADAATRVIVVFDGDPRSHFVTAPGGAARVVRLADAGCEARSFLGTLQVALAAEDIDPDDIVYLTEDDYWHEPGWCQALREGLDLFDYVSAYDHPDKYPTHKPTVVDAIVARAPALRVTASAHWRTAVSTTNTYAARARTLRQDAAVHAAYSQMFAGQRVTDDHEKFQDLWARGRTLGTCVPARATHCEEGVLAPAVDWQARAAAAAAAAED